MYVYNISIDIESWKHRIVRVIHKEMTWARIDVLEGKENDLKILNLTVTEI